jgi:hypothetical protein
MSDSSESERSYSYHVLDIRERVIHRGDFDVFVGGRSPRDHLPDTAKPVKLRGKRFQSVGVVWPRAWDPDVNRGGRAVEYSHPLMPTFAML